MWTTEGNQQVLIPVRELAAWIESNILLQLASAPFDKQDGTLIPAAGSCGNCPKRTGFNKLLFADVRKDSCTDPQCFRAKIDAHVAKTLESKPQLVQISSAWNTREGAPLGRNRYVELEIKKPKSNGTGSKLAAFHQPCEKMTEAVVMDGGRRGELVKVCADRFCRVHHPDTPSPEQVAKERAEERKRIEKNKQAITTRHYVLAKVLERVSAPLKKADLLTVAQYTIGNLSYNQVPALAKRHKVETAKTSKSPQEVLMKTIGTYDEAELSRLLLEISLLDPTYQRGIRAADRSKSHSNNHQAQPGTRDGEIDRRRCRKLSREFPMYPRARTGSGQRLGPAGRIVSSPVCGLLAINRHKTPGDLGRGKSTPPPCSLLLRANRTVPLGQTVQIDFSHGQPCATLIIVVIVV
jgi:hypothetical protein